MKEKIKETCVERYGADNPFSSKEIREKIKETILERYGVEYPTKTKEVQEKIKGTNLERYGVEYPLLSKEIYEKTIDPRAKEKAKERRKETVLKKYGVDALLLNKEIQKKRLETLKLHNTFNISKIQDEIYEYLKSLYPNIMSEYRDKERYPFNCDFYIPDLDLFIEVQGH